MKAPSPDTLKSVKDFSRQNITFAVARADGSDTAYLGCSDFKVYAADFTAAKFEPKELYAHDSYVTGVALAGGALVSCSYDGKLTWFDTEAGQVARTTDAHAKWVRRVAASPDGKFVASVADDMLCKVWDAATGKLVHTLKGHSERTPNNFPSMLYAVAYSADGKYLATGDKVGHVVVWDARTGKELATCEAPVMYTWDKVQRLHSIGGIRSLAFSPDGKSLAVGGMGKVGNIDHLEGKARVEVFDWQAGKQTAEFPGDKFVGLVNKLAWSPDGSWLVGGGGAGEGFLCFFDVATKKTLRQEKLMMHVHDFALSAAGDMITCAGHNRITVHKLG
ncbi:MAG: WD40 repeat domain-containing protein [Gemmata sp.]